MAESTSLIVQIKANLKEFDRALDQAVSRAQKAANGMRDVGKSLSIGLTLPIVAAGGAAIKMASDFEESANKVEVAFGGASNVVKDFAKTTLTSFGIAEGSALDMAALFGDMATSMGISQGAAANMSTQLVGLAGDLASFKNIRLDVAETALKSIFTGETESLKNLGIVMTQANLEAFALEQGMTKNLKAMSEAEKVQLRYNYVLSKTVNAQGDFERTGGGAANQMRIFQESLKQLGQEFGENILPLFTGLITKVNKAVQAFGNLTERAQNIILVVAALAAGIGPLLLGLSAMVKGFIMVKGAVLATKGAFAALRLVVVTNPLIAIITAAVLALATAAVYLWDNWNIVSQHMINAFKMIKNFAIDFVKVTLRNLSTFVDGLIWLGEKVGIHFENPLKSVLTTLEDSKSVIEPVTGEWGSLAESFTNAAVALGLVKDNAEEATKAVEQAGEVAKKITGGAGGASIATIGAGSTATLGGGAPSPTRGVAEIDHEAWNEYINNVKAAELATKSLETVTNGTAQSIVSSLGMIAGESRGFALFEIAANTAIGLAKAVQAGAGLPFPANIPAIGAGTAAVLSGIASAKQVLSSAPAFANGGIVNGSSFSGDRVMARVNSGEMILNRSQQANLFGMINRGGGGNERLITQIAGNDLRIVLERAQRTNNRLR